MIVLISFPDHLFGFCKIILCEIKSILKLILLFLIGVVTSASMWQGVLVNPLDKVYEKPTEKEANVEEMEVTPTEP